MPASLRQKAIFDPQFFLPSVARGKLASYSFFPEIAAEGFSTSDYGDEAAPGSLHACVEFQIAQQFRYIVIPTRYQSGMPSDYIETQERLFVRPFLDAISAADTNQPVLLQIVLNAHMLRDPEYSADIINWITGQTAIAGVYAIFEADSQWKQIKDADFLYRLLKVIAAFRLNSLAWISTKPIPPKI